MAAMVILSDVNAYAFRNGLLEQIEIGRPFGIIRNMDDLMAIYSHKCM